MQSALVTADPDVAVRRAAALAPAIVREIDRVLPAAVDGSDGAARAYARAWRDLVEAYLHAIRDERADVIAGTEDGGLVVIDATGSASPASERVLDLLALQAPFSPWVARYGPGRGAAAYLLNELRAAVTGLEPLAPPDGSGLPHWRADGRRFSHLVWSALAEAAEPELRRVLRVFGLSLTEAAELFGVRRQAVSQWLDRGVPAVRAAKVTAVARVADVLDRMLISDRIPGIARTPATAYGGKTMLGMIAADRHDELLAIVRDSFDWATTG